MGLMIWVLIPGRGKDFSLLQKCPDWSWGPPVHWVVGSFVPRG